MRIGLNVCPVPPKPFPTEQTIDVTLPDVYDGAVNLDSFSSEQMPEYVQKSLRQIELGNDTDDVTLLGTAGQLGLGAGLDLPMDMRDLHYDLTHLKSTPWSQTALDTLALLPVLGDIKYLKNGAREVESAVEGAEAVRDVARAVDAAGDAARRAGAAGEIAGDLGSGQRVVREVIADPDGWEAGVLDAVRNADAELEDLTGAGRLADDH